MSLVKISRVLLSVFSMGVNFMVKIGSNVLAIQLDKDVWEIKIINLVIHVVNFILHVTDFHNGSDFVHLFVTDCVNVLQDYVLVVVKLTRRSVICFSAVVNVVSSYLLGDEIVYC